ncbi:MAG: hypothetical protein GY856_45655 [bacterium]|nr:hypothetical protein [bacterium]
MTDQGITPPFEPAFWGTSSRDAGERIDLAAKTVVFAAGDDGWHRLTAGVEILDDKVRLLRVFEIGALSGGWEKLSVRRHSLRCKSGDIIRETYDEELPLEELARESRDIDDLLKQIEVLEAEEKTLVEEQESLRDLIAYYNNQKSYSSKLQAEVDAAKKAFETNVVNRIRLGYFRIAVLDDGGAETGQYLTVKEINGVPKVVLQSWQFENERQEWSCHEGSLKRIRPKCDASGCLTYREYRLPIYHIVEIAKEFLILSSSEGPGQEGVYPLGSGVGSVQLPVAGLRSGHRPEGEGDVPLP